MRSKNLSRLALSLVFAAVMAFLLMGTAGAETTGTTPDGFTYSITDGAATITGYIGNATELHIPALVEGVQVRSIGNQAFQDKTSLIEVVVPSGVTSIGEGAFKGCSSLKSVTVPDGCESIGTGAFHGCDILVTATIPASVTSLGEYAFGGSQLTLSGYTDYVQMYALARGMNFELISEDIPAFPGDAELDCTITLDKSTLAVGESIIASWDITGGTPPYKILGIWMAKQAIIDEEYQLTAKVIENTSVMTPIIGESGYLLLIVSDAETSIGFESLVFSITGAEVMEPLAVEISFDKMTVAAGQPITASWTITGGLAPYKVYPQWYIYEENRDGEIFIKGDAVGNSCTLTPTTGLEGCFTLYVANANKWGRAYDSEFFSIMPTLDNQGDANGDGGVDIMDLVSIIDYIVSDTSPTSIANADANGDGTVDIMDLVWIIDQIVGG